MAEPGHSVHDSSDSIDSDVHHVQQVDECEENQNKNPWPRLEALFIFASEQNDMKNLHFKCKLCPSTKKALSAFRTSHSNLRKHIKVRIAQSGRQLYFASLLNSYKHIFVKFEICYGI